MLMNIVGLDKFQINTHGYAVI